MVPVAAMVQSFFSKQVGVQGRQYLLESLCMRGDLPLRKGISSS